MYLFVYVCNINKLDVFAADYSASGSNDHPLGDKAPIDLIDLDCILSHVPMIKSPWFKSIHRIAYCYNGLITGLIS